MLNLPSPPEHYQHQSQQLQTLLMSFIAQQGGTICFADFMRKALYEPGLGYYMAGCPRFGAGGDFITAPELSPVFGQCLARFISAHRQHPTGPILEFGAGNGKLAVSLLNTWEQLDKLPSAYYLLEPSPTLQEEQKATLTQEVPHLSKRIHWLSALPSHFAGTVIANEVLDAMPVERIRLHDGQLWQTRVGVEQQHFVWREQLAPAQLQQQFAQLPASGALIQSPDYYTELHTYQGPWLQSLTDSVSAGEVILIDYGYDDALYYHPERRQGTLRCHYQHLAHDNPLILLGLQDITAHVNFSALRQQAQALGWQIGSYSTQAQFLMNNGLIEAMIQEVQNLSLAEQRLRTQNMQKLIEPHHMGELFKVLALFK